MRVQIDSINASDLGPISKLSSKLGRVNLIYGKNENGKTYLVDLILQSLFKNRTSDRALDGSGSLEVTGLDGGPKKFKGSTKPKLEDLLLDSEDATSINLSRLCVVKAGELGFDPKNRNTLPEDTIKGYLSDQKVVEELNKAFKNKKSILNCKITNDGEIEIAQDRGGLIDTYRKEMDLLIAIDKLASRIDQDATATELLTLQEKLDEANHLFDEQETARRQLAYKLQREKDDAENKLSAVPMDAITNAESLFPQIAAKIRTLSNNKNTLEDARKNSAQLQWLNSAIDRFNKIRIDETTNYPIFPILSFLILLLVGIAAFFYQQIWLGLILSLGSLIPFYFSVKATAPNPAKLTGLREQQDIIREFNERFSARSLTIVELQGELEKQKKCNFEADFWVGKIRGEETELEKLRLDLQNNLSRLFIQIPTEGTEENAIRELKAELKTISLDIKELQDKLSELLVAKEDQLPGESKITYDAHLAKTLQEDKNRFAGKIEDISEKFRILYQDAANICQLSATNSPSAIIDALRDKRETTIASLKNSRAQIFAYLAVKEGVDHQAENELQTILATLEASTCSSYLHKITKKYQTLSLVDGQIVLRNGAEIFSLDELSTGTQEQVLLAIRLGLLEHIMGDKRGFIILDDAFQHSDWERRNYLVDTLADIIADGWQVLYFTMDDHIRDLFHKKLVPRFAAEFVEVDLTKAQS